MIGHPAAPLVLVHTDCVTAFEIGSGKLLWQTNLNFPLGNGALRVARSGETLLITYGGEATVLDLRTGRKIASFDLGFMARSVLVHDGYTVFAGEGGVACFRDGALVWRTRPSEQPGAKGLAGLLTPSRYAVVNAQGQTQQQLPMNPGSSELAIVHGEEIVQGPIAPIDRRNTRGRTLAGMRGHRRSARVRSTRRK
jgi:outer membrane protein assembly factor BamB